jgi:formylglycine-generating enzyme required for sulfatase activity
MICFILRGGSYFFYFVDCRSADRNFFRPYGINISDGFRLVLPQ